LNEKLSHSLTLARNTDFGTVTNSTTADSVYYQPIYQLKEDWFLKGRLGYEHGKDSAGANAERYHRRLYGVGVQHTFSRKLRAELDYNYTVNTSNITSRPYNQNQVVLSAEYDF
jgi:predicted porin